MRRSSLARRPSLQPAMWNNPLFHWRPAQRGITRPRDVLCFTCISAPLFRQQASEEARARWRERVPTSGCVNATEGLPCWKPREPLHWPSSGTVHPITCPGWRRPGLWFFVFCFFVFHSEIMVTRLSSIAELRLEPVGKSASLRLWFDGLQTAGWFSKIKQASRSHPVRPFTRWPADLSIFSIRATEGEYKYPDSGIFI